MIDYWNRIISNLATAEGEGCNISSSVSDMPPRFPTLLVDQLDNSDFAVDLENSGAAVRAHMELTAYSNKSLTEVRNIMSTAREAMRLMGFVCNYGPRQIPSTNVNLFRVIARFSRVIGDGDDIPKFET